MIEIDETIAYLVRAECNAALRSQVRLAEARAALAMSDGRFADASSHQTRANRLLGLIEPHDPVSFQTLPAAAAAREPRVGEVWLFDDGGSNPFPRLVVKDTGDTLFAIACDGYFKQWTRCQCIRPAVPKEAAPFRPLLEGLMWSLGEGA